MRIGIFTESFLPQVNGVVTSVCNMAELLSKRHEVKIFTVGKGPDMFSDCGVYRFRGVKLPTYPEYRFFVPSRAVWKTLNRINLNIVHARSSVGFGLVALRAARKMNIPLVGTFDTPISDYIHYVPVLGRIRPVRGMLSDISIKYMTWFYNRCTLVIVPSNATKKWLKSAGCKSNIMVLSNGVDTVRFNPAKKDKTLRKRICPAKSILLLHVGRISREKRVDVLVDAAGEMKRRGWDFRLVIAGNGPALPELRKKVASMGLGEEVKFAGFVPDGQLPKYYATADAFVTASPVETEGIVMLEAMASGLPVIGADAGAVPEIVADGANGFLFAPGNYGELAEKAFKLSDVGIRKSMSLYARRVSARHSVANTVEKLERIYEKLAKR